MQGTRNNKLDWRAREVRADPTARAEQCDRIEHTYELPHAKVVDWWVTRPTSAVSEI
jgi:hypothetical protein